MSDIKHMTQTELKAAARRCRNYIKYHAAKVNGQQTRLYWIKQYIREEDDGYTEANRPKAFS
jgi:hypothetical protein